MEHDADGRKIHIECKICDSQGTIKMDPDHLKANPAFIYSTRGRDSYDNDPISLEIDYIVCTVLTETQNSVLMLAYAGNGTQEMKAKRVKPEKVSQSYFSRILTETEQKIEENLFLEILE